MLGYCEHWLIILNFLSAAIMISGHSVTVYTLKLILTWIPFWFCFTIWFEFLYLPGIIHRETHKALEARFSPPSRIFLTFAPCYPLGKPPVCRKVRKDPIIQRYLSGAYLPQLLPAWWDVIRNLVIIIGTYHSSMCIALNTDGEAWISAFVLVVFYMCQQVAAFLYVVPWLGSTVLKEPNRQQFKTTSTLYSIWANKGNSHSVIQWWQHHAVGLCFFRWLKL